MSTPNGGPDICSLNLTRARYGGVQHLPVVGHQGPHWDVHHGHGVRPVDLMSHHDPSPLYRTKLLVFANHLNSVIPRKPTLANPTLTASATV